MKKFFAAFIVLLAATSCTNESVETVVENNAEQATAPVRVRVSNFSITTEEMPSGGGTTRAAVNPIDYTNVGAIDLVFYDAANNVAYSHTQLRSDGSTFTTFGEFTANLPVGHYTMVAVARYYDAGDAFTLTSATEAAYTSERPRETFTKVQSVTVTSATPLNLDVTLNRISSWLKIISTDGRPASAKKIKTTFAKGGKSFDPSTGLATVDTGFSQTNNPSTAVGATIEVNAVPLLYTDEESMNITIEVLDADENVIGTKVVNNVPFKRNRTGAVFTAGTSGAGFKLETDWLEDAIVNF